MGKLSKVMIGIIGAAVPVVGVLGLAKHITYDEEGYNGFGYNREGYDREGYDRKGFDKEGFNRSGFDKRGFGRDGYNSSGYNRSGFDREGFDKKGFDQTGFNKSGFDRHGYDKEGYNSSGYNRRGFNREGRDIRGFDVQGFDVDGFNRFGYDQFGYDRKGNDISGHSRNYYRTKVSEMQENSQSAHKQMKSGEFAYALRDIRVGLEKGIKAVLAHSYGNGCEGNTLNQNLEICSYKRIFDQEFISKLHEAKNHCNDLAHEDCDKEYNQVHFCYKVLEELTSELIKMTDA